MNNIFTWSRFQFFQLSLLITYAVISGCSSGETVNNQTTYDSDKTFIFKDGSDIYRVEFNGNSIANIFKNEEAIPKEKIMDFEPLVKYELKNLSKDSGESKDKSKHVKIFIHRDEIENDTTSEKDDCFDKPSVFHFKFDDKFLDDMRADLDSLMKELKDRDFEIHINPDDLKIQMKRFKKFFKDNKSIKPPLFDKDEFHKEMEKFRKELKKLDSLDIDLKEFPKKFKKDENIEIIELWDNPGKSEKTNSFINDLTDELVKDSIIESSETNFIFKMNGDEIIVNGKEIPEQLQNKYRELFTKHNKRDLDGEILIEIQR